jgi:hypothetical protein
MLTGRIMMDISGPVQKHIWVNEHGPWIVRTKSRKAIDIVA